MEISRRFGRRRHRRGQRHRCRARPSLRHRGLLGRVGRRRRRGPRGRGRRHRGRCPHRRHRRECGHRRGTPGRGRLRSVRCRSRAVQQRRRVDVQPDRRPDARRLAVGARREPVGRRPRRPGLPAQDAGPGSALAHRQHVVAGRPGERPAVARPVQRQQGGCGRAQRDAAHGDGHGRLAGRRECAVPRKHPYRDPGE